MNTSSNLLVTQAVAVKQSAKPSSRERIKCLCFTYKNVLFKGNIETCNSFDDTCRLLESVKAVGFFPKSLFKRE